MEDRHLIAEMEEETAVWIPICPSADDKQPSYFVDTPVSLRLPILLSFSLCKNCCISVDFIGVFRIHPLGRKCVHLSYYMEVTEEEGEVGQGHAPQGDARQQAPSCLGYPIKERAPTGSRMLRSVHLPPTRGTSWVNEREKSQT